MGSTAGWTHHPDFHYPPEGHQFLGRVPTGGPALLESSRRGAQPIHTNTSVFCNRGALFHNLAWGRFVPSRGLSEPAQVDFPNSRA